MSNRTIPHQPSRFRAKSLALLLAGLAATFAPGWSGWQPARADATDIATLPVFSSTPPAVDVKPNVMFIMDDSGSMEWTYMPDEAGNFAGNYGYASNHCNGVYYNPDVTYAPPVDASGNSYTDQSFNAAAIDGYGLTSGTVNLNASFKAHGWDTAQKAYYYKYKGTQTAESQKNYYKTSSIFYRECNSDPGDTDKWDGVTPVNQVFEKVIVADGTAAEKTNFANWYSYYRTRMNMMKTATGLAFKALDDKFRVGFMSINNKASPAFLNISDFDATHKVDFYAKLYASDPSGSTPIRAALSKAGRLYAGKLTTLNDATVVDPVQYSCQQNYTILSTDGKWNEDTDLVVQLDGTTRIGNQDSALPRPYNDGSSVTTTIVTPYISTQDRTTVTNVGTVTKTWSKTTTTIGAACTASVAPSLTTSAPMQVAWNDDFYAALGYKTSDPDPYYGRCRDLGNNAWFCRGRPDRNPVVSAASVTDDSDKTWYLVNDINGQSGCISARTIWGSDFSSRRGVCPAQSSAGNLVTATPYTQAEILTSYQSTSVDRYLAKQTTTQTIVNGVPGSVGALTPASPAYDFDSNTSFIESSGTHTCDGVSVTSGCDTANVGTWTPGTPTINNVCLATAELPTAGTTTAEIVNTVNTGESQTVTTNQVGTQVAGTPETTSIGTGGIANTLADVAAYYYATNLRTTDLGNCTGTSPAGATNLCTPNTVPKNGVDNATWQHMTTFTLGLGVRGHMVFSPTYLTDSSGDYFDVAAGNTAAANNCSWSANNDGLTSIGGKCNWPKPVSNETSTIDDLWHAGVNGRGNYYSATDPGTLASSLSSTLKKIVNTPRAGTASAAATTNPRITSGNNFQFSSYFKTVEWSGELIRQTMSLADGSVPSYDHLNPDPTAYDWSAKTQLDAKTYSDRKIFTRSGSSLIPFTWADLQTAGLQNYFVTPHISTLTTVPLSPADLSGLSQFCATGDCIDAAAQTNTTVATGGAAGEALVNFLRGDRSNEEGATTDNAKFYRHRASALGDIVSAQPQYVGAPTRYYSDAGYADFKTLKASRQAIVYTAANDGMLHAFNAGSGAEEWAYIPSFSLPRLYTLADKSYYEKHQYFVEGTPIAGDICPKAPALPCDGADWKTILVGGLNAGGTGFYALDVTDPANPALLWEFSHANMGYSFGKPQITKLDDGTWVVLLTSGYNNCPKAATPEQENCVTDGTGDGQGHLYVLNASTGAQIVGSPISTGVGATNNPSGLSQILAQADANNVTKRVYGGDLYGNLWRFSIETAGFGKHLLATLKDADDNVQPITVRPQVTTVNGFPVVYVGTGRYLGASDVGATPKPKNSFYAIKDDLITATTYNNPRSYSSFIGQTAVDTTCPSGTDVSVCLPGDVVRTVTQSTGASSDSLKNMNGWYLDFPADAGEIQFTDPRLALGTLAFSTSVPRGSSTNVCEAKAGASDGDALGYMLDYLTGGAVGTTSGVIATNLGAGVATAPQIAQLPNGTVIAKYRLSTGQEVSVPLRFGGGGGGTKRISWRELVSE